jgi:hypothetical protein
MLEEMQQLLVQHQSVRVRLWRDAEGARGVAKACEKLIASDPQIAVTLSNELHGAMESYGIEANHLIHLIAKTEVHQNKVAMDAFLNSEVKRFVVFQLAALHSAAVEVQFALSKRAQHPALARAETGIEWNRGLHPAPGHRGRWDHGFEFAHHPLQLHATRAPSAVGGGVDAHG